MKIKMYQVDAFAERIFTGNPAAVCILGDDWIDEELMQNIASENNLAETAFIAAFSGEYHIRWFTPRVEVDLCGHATLASGHVMFKHEKFRGNPIELHSKSGILKVSKEGEYLTLDFPSDTIEKVEMPDALKNAFDLQPKEVYKGKTDYMLIYSTERQIRNIKYNLEEIKKEDCRGVIITARGSDADFVSRFFAPQSGVDEDPVTGSSHTTLVPYWSKKLKNDILTARQLSERGGFLKCVNKNDRVDISGKAHTYSIGEITV